MTLPSIDKIFDGSSLFPDFSKVMSSFPFLNEKNVQQDKQVNIENRSFISNNLDNKYDSIKKRNTHTEHRNKSFVYFTEEEENKLQQIVSKYGCNNWQIVANIMGTKTAKQCRDKWYGTFKPSNNYLWTVEEDILLLKQYALLGPRWKKIAPYIPGRTACSIRNRWKKLLKNSQNHLQSKNK